MRTRSLGEHARARGWARVAAAAALAAGGHWLAGCLGNPLPQDPADAGPVEPVPPDAAAPDAAPPDAPIDPGAPDPRGPTLASLFVSGIDTAIAPVPGTTGYEVDLGFWAEEVTVTATSTSTTDTLTIAGAAVSNGAPSQPLAMNVGDNMVDIVVENILGEQRTFRLTLRRAAEIAQYAYCKASTVRRQAWFGNVLALSGDRLAILSGGEDAVYVLGRSGTSWEVEDRLTPAGFDTAGRLVNLALSGDTLAIQATNGNTGEVSSGVYVLRHDGAAWQHEAHLTASITGLDDGFGDSLALAGDLLVVGAPREDSAATGVDGDQEDDSAERAGAAYVFRRTGSTWRQEAYLKASNTDAGDEFGSSVTVEGDLIAVGARTQDSAATGIDGDQDDEGADASGAVYVFRYSGSAWQQEAYVKPSNTARFFFFGDDVALSGDTLAVGAPGESSRSAGIDGDQTPGFLDDSGAVYIYRRSDSGWQQEAYIKASNPLVMAGFGKQVALAGNALAAGAPWEFGLGTGINPEPIYSGSFAGAAYLFHRTGTSWQQDAYVKASNTSGDGDMFGVSVALSSNTLAVGARYESSAGTGINGDQTNPTSEGASSGAVYVFH